jgi:hypothetical protein
MSNQSEHENQQTMTPEEVRQSLLAEIDATKQAIAELSNEQLEEVVGGGYLKKIGQCFGCSKPQTLSPSLSASDLSFKGYIRPASSSPASSSPASSSPASSSHAATVGQMRMGMGGDVFGEIVNMTFRPEAGGRQLFRTLSAPGQLQGH